MALRARSIVCPGHSDESEIVAPAVSGSTQSRVCPSLMSSSARGTSPEASMDTLYSHCAGIDVHKREVVVGVRCRSSAGRLRKDVRRLGTMTEDLLALAEWLGELGVSHVAMESTGVYWSRCSTCSRGGSG